MPPYAKGCKLWNSATGAEEAELAVRLFIAGFTYGEIAEKLSRAMGKRVTHVDVGEEEFKSGMVTAGAPAWYADMVIDLSRYYKAGHAARISPAIQQITGKAPRSFDAFLRDHIAAFR